MPPHGLGLAKNTAPLGQSKKAVRSVIPIFQPNQRGRAEKWIQSFKITGYGFFVSRYFSCFMTPPAGIAVGHPSIFTSKTSFDSAWKPSVSKQNELSIVIKGLSYNLLARS